MIMTSFSKQRPIYSRLLLDYLALLLQAYCFNNRVYFLNVVLLLSTAAITVLTAGATCRWTLTLPMVPFVSLQLSRWLVQNDSWMSLVAYIGSLLCFVAAVILCGAFPTLQLAPIDGKYKVGAVDLFLPVSNGRFITARIYYPTDEQVDSIPYIRPDLCSEYLRETISFGTPAPLNTLSWLFDHWRLIQVPVKLNAQPVQTRTRRFPLIVYSHGIAATNLAYTYQILSQAAMGNVVLAIDHTDGSAPVTQKEDGSLVHFDSKSVEFLYLDTSLGDGWKNRRYIGMCDKRRKQTELRSEEVVGATIALQNLNQTNIATLESRDISFVGLLDIENTHLMGHSFGGATALTAGYRRPDLIRSIIAHEPASDWAPHDVRRALFPATTMDECPIPFVGGTGGWGEVEKYAQGTVESVPTLLLFSSEWYENKWGVTRVLEWMHQNGKMCGDFAIIRQACHSEFTDIPMITNLLIGRSTGLTGQRNPVDTAIEIRDRTTAFLESIS